MFSARTHHIIYTALLCLLAIALPTSVFLMNLVWVLLLANWLIEGNFTSKWEAIKSNRLLHAFLALFLLHLVGLCWSSNLAYGLDDIRKKLPLLVLPLVVLTSSALELKERRTLAFCYVTTLWIVTIIGIVRWFSIPNLPYREIIPYISHIRFSLNLCLAATLLLLLALRGWLRKSRPVFPILCLLLALWFLAFTLFLQSYTALIVLLFVVLALLTVYWKEWGKWRWIASGTLLISAIALGIAIALCIHDYYTPNALERGPLAMTTVNGNPYQHNPDCVMESGGHIETYICRPEMEKEWQKYSTLGIYDNTANGYSVYLTLIRYLNALGVPKDSLGMCHLTPSDVQAIEEGIANPVYLKSISLRRMVYVLLFERESYRHDHAVCDFSMLQRFELWKNGWQVFLQHPLFGTGTGDVVDACHQQLEQSQSPLSGTTKHTHNQYLTLLITFGILGFAILVWLWCRAFLSLPKNRLVSLEGILWVVAIVISLVSFISEDTLETLAGLLFVCFSLSFFYRHVSISHIQ